MKTTKWNPSGFMKELVAQSYPALCNSMDCSPPSSSVHGIIQARILDWVAIPFFRDSSQPRDWTWVSYTAGRLFTNWATRSGSAVNYNKGQKKLVWIKREDIIPIQKISSVLLSIAY